jgi:hypothetical protein
VSITAPFQRRVINPLQRPLSSDLNLQAFYDSATQSFMAGAFFSGPSFPYYGAGTKTGFIGNGFAPVGSSSSRAVVLRPGIGFKNIGSNDVNAIGGVVGVNEYAKYAPMVCAPSDPASEGFSVAIEDEAVGYTRIDLICVKPSAEVTDFQSIGVLNPSSSTFSLANKPQQLTFNTTDIIVVKGDASTGTPTPPAVPSGYTTVAAVLVPSGSGLIPNANIIDGRQHLLPFGTSTFSATVMSKETVTTAGVWEATGARYIIVPTEFTPAGSSDVWKVFSLIVDGVADLSNTQWTTATSFTEIPPYGTAIFGSLGLRMASAMVSEVTTAPSSIWRASFDAEFPGESFSLHDSVTIVSFIVGTCRPLTGVQNGVYIDFVKANVEASNNLDYRVTIRGDVSY